MRTHHFLKAVDHDKIVSAIAKAEEGTTGEIFVFVSRHKVTNALAEANRCIRKLKIDKAPLRNGVLIFVCPRSHNFAVVGDAGVHAKCPEDFWSDVVEAMRLRLQRGEFSDALLYGIQRVGSLLAIHFPAVSSTAKHPSGGVVEE